MQFGRIVINSSHVYIIKVGFRSNMKSVFLAIIAVSLLTITMETSIQPVNSQTASDDSEVNEKDNSIGISLNTKNSRYLNGEVIMIGGHLFDKNGQPTPGKVSIKVTEGETVYEATTFAHGGIFNHTLKLDKVGKYTISAISDINGEREMAFKQIEVIHFWTTIPFEILVFGFIAFGILMIMMARQTKNMKRKEDDKESKNKNGPSDSASIPPPMRKEDDKESKNKNNVRKGFWGELKGFWGELPDNIPAKKAIHFTLISILMIIPTAAFVTIDFEIGTNAPVSLILKSTSDDVSKVTSEEWLINIGGHWSDNYNSAIQIPVYVFIFGIAGGYIRFLYVMFKYGDSWDTKKYQNYTIKDLTTLFLSPLLAIVSYLFFLQSAIPTPTNLSSIAIASIAAGLTTQPIINQLENLNSSHDGNNGEEKQKVAAPEEVEKLIEEGWQYVRTLPNGKVIVKKQDAPKL